MFPKCRDVRHDQWPPHDYISKYGGWRDAREVIPSHQALTPLVVMACSTERWYVSAILWQMNFDSIGKIGIVALPENTVHPEWP